MDTFAGMKAWIPLSLSLLFGQTPPAPDARVDLEPDEQPTAAREDESPPLTEEEEALPPEQEVQRLRAQLEALDTQLKARQAEEETQRQEAQNRLQILEERQQLETARADELEQLRQQRLESLELAYDWLISADEQLQLGELDIGPTLAQAQRELSTALSTADETGRGQVTQLLERAVDRLAVANEAAEERDVYPARLELQAASFELREAWRLTLNRSDATLVNQ